MLDDSQFVLEDRRGKLDLSRPWSQILRPNQKVDMSMIFHRDIHPSICPVCKSLNESGFGSAIECQSCGLYYQRVLELVTEAATSSDDTHATPLDQHDPSYDDGLERISTPEHNDVIDQFRRVRLISTGFQGEFDGHAEPSTTSAGQQLVQEDDGHTTARMHKGRPMPTVGEDIATYQPLTRPLSSYLDLVRHALLSSKTGQMSLAQIFHAIEQKHPFYKSQAQTFGWRTSIRRILKQNPSFCKIERDGASTVWRFSSKRDTPKRKQLRSPPMPIQASAASASPLHLFDMSAALLSGVEQHHKDSLDVRETHDPEKH
ncbi:MAG: hypothetical protein LQ349_008480 [Xanthoria aureola]|nr:MAG: hypothetical protein LQ349_008480 [Xanthoria aureola]